MLCPRVWAEDQRVSLYEFEDGAKGWRVLKDGALSEAACETAEAPEGSGKSLRMDAVLPGTAGAGVAFKSGEGRWHQFTNLSLRVYVPREAPAKVQAIVYLKDSGLYYYQHFDGNYLPKGQWTELKLDLTERGRDWEACGHYKPWDGYCREEVLEFGVKFIGSEAFEGAFFLDSVALERNEAALPRQNVIYNLRPNSAEVGRYEKFEVTFNLARTYANPFDPDEVNVVGRFICPDGSTVAVPGFFYQGYLRRMDRGAEDLVPMGQSQWKVRFAPQQLGTYRYYIEVNDGERVQSELGTFQCRPSANHGFVRLSRTDPDYFEFDDGTFYFPIGHNIASVQDVRAGVMGVSLSPAEGTFAYDRFLSRMGASGENFGRVWMTPWSFSIEWTKAYDIHFQGLGRYNLCNAWRLDHVVETARKNGVYLMLLFTSHGEVGESESHFYGADPEHLQGSPYWSRYGGPLKGPLNIYDSPEALKFYKRKVRYVAARWGYATSIMSWEILNEPDLAFARGGADALAVGRKAAEFVRQAILEIRQDDPARHLTTSGMWQHTGAHAAPTLSLKEMDFFGGHTFAPDLAAQLAADRRYIKGKFGKTLFVTEAGLTAHPQDPGQTERAIHGGLWMSYLLPLPGTACPWWWVLIDQKDLYGDFAGLAAFAKGEDRRGMNFRSAGLVVKDLGTGRQLMARCLKNETRAFCWVYNSIAFSSQASWTEQKPAGASVTVPGLRDGPYTVQIWDTGRGTVLSTSSTAAQGGAVTFELPPFSQDIACKATHD